MKDTSQRILTAAYKVFARDGISGATTREIARVARVNEVTLFRYFKNKNELLRQVVLQMVKRNEDFFADASLESAADLHRTIEIYAMNHWKKMLEHETFIRTFFGELKRHQILCRELFVNSSHNTRQKFIDYLKAAQKARLIRKDVDVMIAADALGGMLFSGTMRRPLYEGIYTEEAYVKTCLQLFLKGLEP